MKKWQKILIATLIAANAASPALVIARTNATHYYRTANAASNAITEEKAIRIAKQHIKGRVLAINLSDHIYRIKILDYQGSMHIVLIDATDGMILSTH